MRGRSFIILPLVLLLSPLRAEELTAALDQAKTKITFTLKDVLHTVHGSFQLKEGHVSFDPATGAITGDVVVNAATGNSGSEARDKRMTRNILEAQRYPEIRFIHKGFAGSISGSIRFSSARPAGVRYISYRNHRIVPHSWRGS